MKISKNSEFISTSFFGDTIYTSANNLIQLFGEYSESDPFKINYEWNLILNDEIPFTIYDWKEPNLDLDEYIDYHIGARNKEESTKIKKCLNKTIK